MAPVACQVATMSLPALSPPFTSWYFPESSAAGRFPVASDARGLTQVLVRYRAPNLARSTVELVITAGPLVLLWSLMWATLDLSYWLCLLLAVPAAGFLVRLFMIQHDCGHGAFFHRRCTNDGSDA
jgi:fatty acid desaturase